MSDNPNNPNNHDNHDNHDNPSSPLITNQETDNPSNPDNPDSPDSPDSPMKGERKQSSYKERAQSKATRVANFLYNGTPDINVNNPIITLS